MGGIWRDGPFTGDSEGYPRGAPLGTTEGTLLYRELRGKGKILFYQEALFIGESDRYVKGGSGNGQLSP